MLDLANEAPLSMKAAARLPMLARDGRPPNVAQLYRWSSRGVSGIRLETAQVGERRVTTAEAVRRWIEAVTLVTGAAATIPNAPPPKVARRRAHQQARRVLEAAGIA